MINRSQLALLLLILPLFLFAVNRIYFSRISVWEIPALINGLRAKEFCTCYFIMQKGKDYCLEAVNYGYPMMGYEINEKNRAVRFDFLWNSRLAMNDSERFGCQLK